jgi:hypothetical protein
MWSRPRNRWSWSRGVCAGYRQGERDGVCAGPARRQANTAPAGGPRVRHAGAGAAGAGRLAALASVQLVAMEQPAATGSPRSTCWKPKGSPAGCSTPSSQQRPRPAQTDRLDAVWLAKVVERGMCQPSLVHPKPIRRLRDLTRYRRSLIRERTRDKQRLEQLLEDAQIKLSSVISDIFGVSGRQMLAALIAGQRDPRRSRSWHVPACGPRSRSWRRH